MKSKYFKLIDSELNEISLNNVQITPENTVEIKITPKDAKSAKGEHCFGVSYMYQVSKPQPNPESPLALTVSQKETDSLKKYTIKIKNKENKMQGMLICIISLQTGLKVNLNDLEGLRRNEVVDFYEMRNHNSEVILYWRGMSEKGKRKVKLSFLKEFKVKDALPTLVSTYLYYDKGGSLISQLL
jgi:hypothetical protein